jgi:hypothetical protein
LSYIPSHFVFILFLRQGLTTMKLWFSCFCLLSRWYYRYVPSCLMKIKSFTIKYDATLKFWKMACQAEVIILYAWPAESFFFLSHELVSDFYLMFFLH